MRSPKSRSVKKLNLHKFLTETQIKSLKREAKKVMNGSLPLSKFKILLRKMLSYKNMSSKSKSRSIKLRGGSFFSSILSLFGFETEKPRKRTPEEQAEYEEDQEITRLAIEAADKEYEEELERNNAIIRANNRRYRA